MKYREKIFLGLKWAGIQLALNALIKFSIKLLLARLLAPNAFGLIGMSLIFIAVAQSISELGMGAALIQKKEAATAEKMYSTVFWTNLLWSWIMYLIMWLIITPMASSFFNEPQLMAIIPVLCLSVLFRPFSLIPSVTLTRKLDFKKLAKINNTASFIAGFVALVLAYLDYGVWALVLNYIITFVISAPLYLMVNPWLPKWEWNLDYFKDVFSFGLYSTGNSLLRTISFNVDNLMIGKILGSTSLGMYTLAYTLTDQLRMFISTITNQVLYPVFSQIQDDSQKLRITFTTVVKYNAILIFPIMSSLIIFSRDIIFIFFGEQWEGTILPLQILSFAIIVNMLVNSFDTLIRGKGKPKLEFQIMLFTTLALLVPCLYIGITNYGLIGAAYAILFSRIGLTIIGIAALRKEIELKIMDPFIAISSAIFSIAIAYVVLLMLDYALDLKSFYIRIIIFGLIYLFSIFIFEGRQLRKLLIRR